ncbi:MAG: hypothetical protein E6713_04925 [Sporomusaceae bacterium]|nr:hypothetical protein [Sporomusaceae bacterium]
MENPFVIYSFHRDEAGAMDDFYRADGFATQESAEATARELLAEYVKSDYDGWVEIYELQKDGILQHISTLNKESLTVS